MGNAFQPSGGKVTNLEHINECIQEHPVEKIGTVLRAAMAPEKQVLSHVYGEFKRR